MCFVEQGSILVIILEFLLLSYGAEVVSNRSEDNGLK